MKATRMRFRTGIATAAVAALFVVCAGTICQNVCAAPVPGWDVTYTLDADFDQGTLLNVNHDFPNNNQLQLNSVSTPFPYVNIACSARGTVVRIDVNTGVILGEYLTAPDGMGRDPSRTTVDKFGNVWVSNRAEAGGGKGSVTRIAIVIGGTRCDADGTPNPNGQYLKPPWQYSTAVDRDLDGLIKTSRGLADILPWTNAGGADTNGGVSTADDELIINYTRVNGTNTRTVAVDANNDIWTGGLGNQAHEKISGVTGQPIPGTQLNFGCGGYGGLVDGNGILWSARGGTGLLRYDPVTNTGVCLDGSHGDYGLGIDPNTGHIWHTNLVGNRVAELDAAGNLLNAYAHGNIYAQGVVVDGSGNVWVAHSLNGPSNTVGHLRTNGTFVGNVVLPNGSGPTGVAVDANGKVWVANIYSNNAMRIDPNAGPIGGGGFPVGAVDMTVGLGAGAGPYNYSDMTGFVSVGTTTPQGAWTVVQDAGLAGTDWQMITWNTEPEGSEPAGTSIAVYARASDTEAGLPGEVFMPVGNGVPFSLLGRFVEVQALLRTKLKDVSPVLSDIRVVGDTPPIAKCMDVTVSAGPDCTADASIDAGSYDPDGDPITLSQSPPGPYGLGSTLVTLTVTDDSGKSATCTGTVTVVDTTPPLVRCAFATTSLWTPNHNMVNVGLAIKTIDNCDPDPVVGVAVYSNEGDEEPTGDGNFSPDAKDIAAGTLRLRAERKGDGDGRVYLVLATSTDSSGNVGCSCCTVVVPHSQSAASVALVDSMAASAKAYCEANCGPPPGYVQVGIGPIIGPKQ